MDEQTGDYFLDLARRVHAREEAVRCGNFTKEDRVEMLKILNDSFKNIPVKKYNKEKRDEKLKDSKE